MRNSILIVSCLLAFLSFSFLSCSKDAQSKPYYIFKSPPKEGVVAKIYGEEISYKELVKGIENKVHRLEMQIYQEKMNRFYTLLLDKFIEKDPKSAGISRDEFLDKYINRGREISAKEIENFIQKLIKEKRILSEHVNDAMKEKVRKHLDRQMKQKSVDSWLVRKTKKNPAEIYFAEPPVPVLAVEVGDAPFDGPEDAKVTLVEFSDFECQHCANAVKTLEQIKKKYGSKIKVVFKNFPLPYHRKAKGAALAGLCAYEQGRSHFWKLHDLMFADQKKLDEKDIMETGKKIGLNLDTFKACMDSKKYTAKIDQDINQGRDLGVSSTPSFFINGKMVSNPSFEHISKMINQELR